MTKEEAITNANDLKNQLRSASDQEVIAILNEVSSDMEFSQFRKPVVKYRAEAVLFNKRAKVNKTTRDAYKRFCANVRICAKDNATMLAKVTSFEKQNNL